MSLLVQIGGFFNPLKLFQKPPTFRDTFCDECGTVLDLVIYQLVWVIAMNNTVYNFIRAFRIFMGIDVIYWRPINMASIFSGAALLKFDLLDGLCTAFLWGFLALGTLCKQLIFIEIWFVVKVPVLVFNFVLWVLKIQTNLEAFEWERVRGFGIKLLFHIMVYYLMHNIVSK